MKLVKTDCVWQCVKKIACIYKEASFGTVDAKIGGYHKTLQGYQVKKCWCHSSVTGQTLMDSIPCSNIMWHDTTPNYMHCSLMHCSNDVTDIASLLTILEGDTINVYIMEITLCFNCMHACCMLYFSGYLFIATTDAHSYLHKQTHLGCCGYAWMQLFSVTALIISFNEHHSLLFPSAWFSLSLSLYICLSLHFFLFLSLSITLIFLTSALSLCFSLSLRHTHTITPSPKHTVFPLVWSSINGSFHIRCV